MESNGSPFYTGLTLPRAAAILGTNLLYSTTTVLSKYAARSGWFSTRFFLFLGLLVLALFAYAVIWQQLIKRMPLSTVYPFKGVVVIYNLVWALLLFGEQITPANVIGSVLILTGIFVVSRDG